MECIFCKVIKGELPSYKIYDDDYVVAFLDIAPVNEGHILVVPKKHFDSLEDVDELMLSYIMNIVKKCGAAIEKTLGVKGYNVIINNGSVAGQVINHFHCHVIPRRDDDGLHNWPQKNYPEGKAEEIVAKLAAELKK